MGPIGQCDPTFRLGNKQFMNSFIVLQDLWRNPTLGLNWYYKYIIVCSWNVNGQQYITHNNTFLCPSIASSNMEPLVWKAGALKWPQRSISIISVQAPTKLNTISMHLSLFVKELLGTYVHVGIFKQWACLIFSSQFFNKDWYVMVLYHFL